jgi:hypothetical protein
MISLMVKEVCDFLTEIHIKEIMNLGLCKVMVFIFIKINNIILVILKTTKRTVKEYFILKMVIYIKDILFKEKEMGLANIYIVVQILYIKGNGEII